MTMLKTGTQYRVYEGAQLVAIFASESAARSYIRLFEDCYSLAA
jgi:hypothetical protein